MDPLQVEIDPAESGRLIFSRPVSLADDAMGYLWRQPPKVADALRPDPNEIE